MKQVGVIFAFLTIATLADAAMKLSVNDVVDAPDTEVYVYPSDHVIIDVHSFGEIATIGGLIITEGPASVDASNAWIIENWGISDDPFISDVSDDPLAISYLEGLGYAPVSILYFEIIEIACIDVPIPDGKVIDSIDLHCIGPGDVTITLLHGGAEYVLDTQVIHQVFEPMGVALLGLGGLLLRRRQMTGRRQLRCNTLAIRDGSNDLGIVQPFREGGRE